MQWDPGGSFGFCVLHSSILLSEPVKVKDLSSVVKIWLLDIISLFSYEWSFLASKSNSISLGYAVTS